MTSTNGLPGVVVDCAGARMGGALRFMHELDGYLSRAQGIRAEGIRAIGRRNQVTGRWLVERELRAGRCRQTVAVNNVTFACAGRFKTVLLRNALHFLSDEERAFAPVDRRMRAQTAVVRGTLRRADRIVVPTSSMATRVATQQPRTEGRIRVMHHPLSQASPSREPENVVLCPVLNAPWKMLGPRLAELIAAMTEIRAGDPRSAPELLLTLTSHEAAALGLRLPAWVRLLGRLTPGEVSATQQSARVIAYPTTIESFGYPLAEAHLARQPVIAPDTGHAREVAGDALVGYDPSDTSSLGPAISKALDLRLEPLTENPFDPDAYFNRLFSGG